MKQKYQPDPSKPNYMPDVYDMDKVRIVAGSRGPYRTLPSAEAAALRRAKRKRAVLARLNRLASDEGPFI